MRTAALVLFAIGIAILLMSRCSEREHADPNSWVNRQLRCKELGGHWFQPRDAFLCLKPEVVIDTFIPSL